jgi:hypothetical protein
MTRSIDSSIAEERRDPSGDDSQNEQWVVHLAKDEEKGGQPVSARLVAWGAASLAGYLEILSELTRDLIRPLLLGPLDVMCASQSSSAAAGTFSNQARGPKCVFGANTLSPGGMAPGSCTFQR